MTNITTRQIKFSDFTAIQYLNHSLFLYEKQFTNTYNEWWPYEKPGIEYLTHRILNEDNNSITLLSEVNNEVVGYIIGRINTYTWRSTNPIAEIENMFVLEEYRYMGVGTHLVERFLQEAKSLGAQHIKVETLFANKLAIEFYHKFKLSPHSMVLEMQL